MNCMEGTALLKIGDFSKLSRISVRMLRHYDEIGLLRPVYVDRFTDYSYYDEHQLPTVGRITALKDMGFHLAEIGQLLELYDDKDALDAHLAAQQQQLELLAADTAQRLRLIAAARNRLRKDEPMKYNVTLKTLPERYCATVRMTIPCYEDEGMVWSVLCRETAAMALVPGDPCYCAVTFLDGEFKETDVELEAWKTVKGTYPDTPHVKFRTLPAVTVASCIFRGPYSGIGEVYAALAAWIEANGYEYDGPMFNIYHVSPHETQDPQTFVTEACYPVRKK